MEALAVRWLFPGHEISVHSHCLDCGDPIHVRMKDEAIVEIEPPTAVAYMTSPFSKWREGSAAFH